MLTKKLNAASFGVGKEGYRVTLIKILISMRA